ncbi:MAG: GLPGLI family protein [Flavobacteriaceae bacterium]|nr:MAG: GLPGLI family protein [Flavobacteriaceae bacterium]
MKYLKNIIILFILVFSVPISAQNTNGKAYYVLKNTIKINLSNRQIPEAQKAMIQERINSMSTNNFVLSFNKNSSIYVEEEKLEQDQGNGIIAQRMGMMKMILNQGSNGKLYKNNIDNTYKNQVDLYGKLFLIQDSLKAIDWKITDDVKTIGKHTCFKATAILKNRGLPTNFRPGEQRTNDSKEERKIEDEMIIVTAWFTLDIPVSQGPAMYYGLPGLILEVNAGNTTILCSKIELNKEEETINPPKKGKKITQEKYDALAKKKAQEVRENFRRGRAGLGKGN